MQLSGFYIFRVFGLRATTDSGAKFQMHGLGFNPNGRGEKSAALNPPLDGLKASSLSDAALKAANATFRGGQRNNAADAYRHIFWSAAMTKELGPSRAKLFEDSHERSSPGPYVSGTCVCITTMWEGAMH
jgi:hypothetical protein